MGFECCRWSFDFLVSGMVMFGRLACACDCVLPVMFRFLVDGFVFWSMGLWFLHVGLGFWLVGLAGRAVIF